MPKPKSAPKKIKEDRAVTTSVTRPQSLFEAFENRVREMAVELKIKLNHSKVVCAMERLDLENLTFHKMVLEKVKEIYGKE